MKFDHSQNSPASRGTLPEVCIHATAGTLVEHTHTIGWGGVNRLALLCAFLLLGFSGNSQTITITPAPGANTMYTVTGNIVNGRNEYNDGNIRFIRWSTTLSRWELVVSPLLSVEYFNTANTATPPCSANYPWQANPNLALPAITVTSSTPCPVATPQTPSQSDEILPPGNADGGANAGETIRYKVTVTNPSNVSIDNLQLNIVPDPRTTLQNGSLRSSPVAFPDTYTATGNVGISVTAGSGVLANDYDDNTGLLTVTPVVNQATTQGGSVTLNGDGSFSYTPPPGFNGDDTFTYTLIDGNPVGAPIPTTDLGTVTISVTNLIWFVDNTGGGSGGAGTLTNPFKTPADFNASSGPAAGHLVFLKNTGTDYTSGFVLKNTQQLFGSGHTGGATLASVLPFSLAPNSPALPVINTTAPVITNASGNAVQLAQGNTVRGIAIGNTSGYAFIDNGGTVGTATILETSISGTGGLFNLTNGGTVNATLAAMSSSSASGSPITLTNMAGTISNTSGVVSNAASADLIRINGGTVTVNSPSTFTKTAGTGNLLAVLGGHTGTLTLSAALTKNGGADAGMLFDNADGTYTLSGAVSLSAGSGGVNIQNGSGGTLQMANASSAIQSIAGISFRINTSTMGVTYAGNITHTSQTNRGIEIIGSTGAIAFTGICQIGTSLAQMTTAEGVFLDNTGATNAISFSTLNLVSGIPGGLGKTALVSQTSGQLVVNAGSVSCSGAVGTDRYCLEIANTTSGGVTFNTLDVDLGDAGESGGALLLNTTPGVFTFQSTMNLEGSNATLIKASTFGTLNIGGTLAGLMSTTNRPVLDIASGAINIKATTITTTNTTTQGIRLASTTGTQLMASGAVSISSAAGASESILLDNVSTSTVSLGVGTTVTLTSRRSNGVHLKNSSANVSFGNTTIANPNSITLPGIRSTGCSGSVTFAQANVDMNSAGGFETFTDEYTPNDNDGDGDAIYITTYTGSGFAINGGTIENAGDDGIDIRNSGKLTLNGVTIEDVGKNAGVPTCVSGCNSSGVQAFNLSGTNTVTNSVFQRGRLRNFYWSNNTGTGAALNITGSSFDDTRSQGSPATDNLQVYLSGSASAALDIESSMFTRSRTDEISVIVKGTAAMTKLDITSIIMDNNGGDSGGIRIAAEDAAAINFNVMNNTKLYTQAENVVTVAASGTSTVQGRIKGNTDMKIIATGTINNGIRVLSDGSTSVATVLIEGNSLAQTDGNDGINVAVQGTGSARINATINANTVMGTSASVGSPLEGVHTFVNSGGVAKVLCLDVNNNAVSGAWARAGRARALGPTGIQIFNFTTDYATTWTNHGNTGAPVIQFTSGGGTIVNTAMACPLPINPNP